MIARDTFCLETERMTLRPPRLEDADAIQILADDFEIARWMSSMPYPYPDGGALDYLSRVEDSWGNNSDMGLALIERETNSFMGILGVMYKEESFWEVGYWIGQPYWGQGFAAEATKAALTWAFATFGMEVIRARHFVGNEASARVLMKCGFTYTGETMQIFSKSLDREVENLWMELPHTGFSAQLHSPPLS